MPTISILRVPSMLTEDDIRKKCEEVNLGIIESIEMVEHTRGFLSYRNFRIHYIYVTDEDTDTMKMTNLVGLLCAT